MPTIYWAGDSTVQTNDYSTYPQTGIGQVFKLFVKDDVNVCNHARNGRSTKSFIDESRMIPIYDNITAGDFLFIQFGHNDEKLEDPARGTHPYGDFQENLEKFVNVARNKKAYPVLITPLARRRFDKEGNIGPATHGEYVDAIKALGARLNVPVIDLTTESRNLLAKEGMLKSREWYMNFDAGIYEHYPEGKDDNTHLRYQGAVVYAKLIADGLKKFGGIYEDLIIDYYKKDEL